MTAEERHEYSRQIQASIERAERNIATLYTRRLTPEQTRGISRIESFLRQARDARTANDLATARNLAERADLLSQDLLRQ